MALKAVQINQPDRNSYAQNNNLKDKNPSFQGMGNPVVTLMDAIDRGGFAASFIAQDGIGMVAPRIYEGMNRNREQTGQYNWEFARKEGLREILSGPSAFIIPSIILATVKKTSGTANNVPVDLIDTYGSHFAKYASANKASLQDGAKAKKEFYEEIFKNVLKNSTEQKLPDNEVKRLAKHFTEKTLEMEKAKPKGFFNNLIGKKVEGSSQDLLQELADEFMEIRKGFVDPSADFMTATVKADAKDKSVSKNFKKMVSTLKDYTGDVIEKTSKSIAEATDTKGISKIVDNFNLKRMGTRIATNFGMWGAVVAFYTVIPKLYSLGLKGNPGLNGLDAPVEVAENAENTEGKDLDKSIAKDNNGQPSFTGAAGAFGKVADKVTNTSWMKKVADTFEFSGATMSVPAMLTLLFGFCLPTRYFNAKDKVTGKPDVYDRKEILVRDITSFISILFGAKALSRGFSDLFAKASGLALNMKPEDHNTSFFHKVKNYFTAGSGVNVLNSEEIVSKYSNIEKYNDGINGFFKFLKSNGGDVKRTLMINETVKTNAEKIVGKTLKDATTEEIENAFKSVKDKQALENIYEVFRNTDNQLIKRAKTMNSAFGFASTLVLVPVFMMWLARYCERMTKNAVARDKAKAEAAEMANQPQPQLKSVQETNNPNLKVTKASNTPSMDKFLAK